MVHGCPGGSGTHILHAFDDAREAARVAGRFLAAGLLAGDACVYFGDEKSAALALAEAVRRTGTLPERNALRVVGPTDVFLRARPSPLGSLLTLRNHLVAQALTKGRRVRFILVPAAEAADDEVRERTEAFESLFTVRGLAGTRLIRALCQYERSRYPAELLEAAFAAHPTWVVDEAMQANPMLDTRLGGHGRVA